MADGFGDRAFGAGYGRGGSADAFGGEHDYGADAAYGRGTGVGNASETDDLFGPLGEEERQRLARAFEQGRGPDGFVPADEGRRQLERTGLSNDMLQSIWHLSDLDRDGRLSLREFVCAVHLADQARLGHSLPADVKAEQQVALARGVEALVSGTASGHAAGPEVLKPPRHDDFSTVDTHASRGRHLDGFSSGVDLDVSEPDISAFGSRGHFDGLGPVSSQRRGGQAPILEEVQVGAGHGRLGQLASVFEVVGRLDPDGELRRVCNEVFDERKQLEQSLAQRRELEKQLRQVRGELDSLRDGQRKVEVEKTATQRRISHLQDEIAFVEGEVRGAEEDLQMLREANGGNLQDHRRGPAPYSSAEEERRDMVSKMRAERELLQKDQRSIEDIRLKLNGIFKDKLDTQVMQQSLLEKQRQTEQDRGLMLTAIEAERGKLSAMAAERLRLWEERSTLEREMTELAQEQWLSPDQSAGRAGPGMGTRGRSVPVAGNFHTAPPVVSQPMQQRSAPHEEHSSIIYGSHPGAFEQDSVARSMNSFGGDHPGQFQSSAHVPSSRADHRGVRH